LIDLAKQGKALPVTIKGYRRMEAKQLFQRVMQAREDLARGKKPPKDPNV